MRKMKLTRKEKEIDDAFIRGEYVNVSPAEFASIAREIAHRRKDTVLNIRVNSEDLKEIKRKAQKLGVKYQTFIAELLHQFAHS